MCYRSNYRTPASPSVCTVSLQSSAYFCPFWFYLLRLKKTGLRQETSQVIRPYKDLHASSRCCFTESGSYSGLFYRNSSWSLFLTQFFDNDSCVLQKVWISPSLLVNMFKSKRRKCEKRTYSLQTRTRASLDQDFTCRFLQNSGTYISYIPHEMEAALSIIQSEVDTEGPPLAEISK